VAEQALAVALRRRDRGVTGFDVAGDETVRAADPAFEPLFAAAKAGGLHLAAHAGEAAGPESVEGAATRLGARRIGHGTRAAEDPALLARLARAGVVFEVCPTSNVALKVVPSIAAHPVRAFLDAGIRCTVATDDPSLFGTDLVTEMVRLHRERGLSPRTLAAMAADGFAAAFVEPGPGGEALRGLLAAWEREARTWFDDDPPG
jgi:adenosine deaminase